MVLTWYKETIKKYNELIVLQVSLIPLVPFIITLVQSIMAPGPVYCDETPCPSKNPPMADIPLLIPIVVVYTYCVVLAFSIIQSSGGWMSNAVRNKLISLFVLIIISCSLVLLIAPVFHRKWVIPYHRVQQYSFTLTKSDQLTTIICEDTWNSDIHENSKVHMKLKIWKVSGDESDLNELSPLSKLVYEEGDFSLASQVSQGTVILKTIQKELVDGQWYMIAFVPVSKGASGNPFEISFLKSVDSITLWNGEYLTDVWVDLRAFTLCKWSSESNHCVNN